MKMTNTELRTYYRGAYFFEETDEGYLQAFQYGRDQMAFFKEAFDFWYDRCMASTSKTIEFATEATEISFDYKIIWIGSPDSFEVLVDGLAAQIYYVKDIDKEGRITFTLPEGRKNVAVYLPCDATVLIKNFEVNSAVEALPGGTKVLWLGDSITQGFGPLRSSCTYVSVANRILKYDILNHGIGGYIYHKGSLMDMPGYTPEKIIVSLGTNQYETESMEYIEDYYKKLAEVYGTEIPVLCITPIWRGDNLEKMPVLISFREKLEAICRQYGNVRIVDGFQLVPHLSEYYLDNLHPNCLGAEIYGRNLAQAIEELGF